MLHSRNPGRTSRRWLRRSTLVLLGTMTLALLVGLLAWGPIEPHRHGPPVPSDMPSVGMRWAFPLLAWALVCLAAWAPLWRSSTPAALLRPWRLYLGIGAASALLGALDPRHLDATACILLQALAATSSMLLLGAFLAEHLDAKFGSRSACTLAGLLALAGCLWAVGWTFAVGTADLRALWLLQSLPLLLAPAGALGLAGRSGAGDWTAIVLLHAAGRWLAMSGAAPADAQPVAHLLAAMPAAVIAYRMRSSRPLAAAPAGSRSRSITSANTAG